jgi:hypothetical protein
MTQQINLYDPSYGPRSKPFAARTMAGSLLVLVAAAGGLHVYVSQQGKAAERMLKDAEARLADQRERTAKIAAELAAGGGRSVGDEIARLENRLAARREVLSGVTSGVSANLEGYSGLMSAFARSTRPGLWLTGFSVSERSAVEIRGRVLEASLVSAYMSALNREPTIQGRSVSELKLSAKSEPAATKPPAEAAPGPGPARFIEFTVALSPRGGAGDGR